MKKIVITLVFFACIFFPREGMCIKYNAFENGSHIGSELEESSFRKNTEEEENWDETENPKGELGGDLYNPVPDSVTSILVLTLLYLLIKFRRKKYKTD